MTADGPNWARAFGGARPPPVARLTAHSASGPQQQMLCARLAAARAPSGPSRRLLAWRARTISLYLPISSRTRAARTSTGPGPPPPRAPPLGQRLQFRHFIAFHFITSHSNRAPSRPISAPGDAIKWAPGRERLPTLFWFSRKRAAGPRRTPRRRRRAALARSARPIVARAGRRHAPAGVWRPAGPILSLEGSRRGANKPAHLGVETLGARSEFEWPRVRQRPGAASARKWQLD